MLVTVEVLPSPQVITAVYSAAVAPGSASVKWKRSTLLKATNWLAAGGVRAPAVSGASATLKLPWLAPVLEPSLSVTCTLKVAPLSCCV